MSTEKDVYELDVSDAQSALEKVTEAAGHAEKGAKSLQEQINEMGNEFAKKIVELETYKEALEKVFEVMQEGVKEYLESEAAITKLNATLSLMGNTSLGLRDALHEQAEAIQATTGASKESVTQIQSLLASYQVGPEYIERFTDAAFRMASVTGSAERAAMLLARANSEGKEELKRYNIEVDSGTFAQEGFAAVLEQVEAHFPKLDAVIDANNKRVNEAASAWKEFKEEIGKAVVNSDIYKEKLDGWTFTLETITKALKGKEWAEPGSLGYFLEHGTFGNAQTNKDFETMGTRLADAINKQWEALHPKEEEVQVLKPFDITAGAKEAEAEDKLRAADIIKHKTYLEKLYEDERTLRDKQEQETEDEAAKEFLTWKNVKDDQLKSQELGQKALIENSKKWNEQEIEAHKKKAEEIKTIEKDMYSTLKSFAQEALNALGSFLKESLLSNTEYNRELKEQSIRRQLVGLSETEAAQKRLDIEKKLQQEEVASVEKKVAEVLASIAQQAAVKALMEGAEAIASAAEYDYEAAYEHGVAAALFAGVALATGVGAYAISSSRGLSSDEASQLDSQQQANQASSAATAAKQAGQNAANSTTDAGPQVQVNYLGIAGVTELQQAAELERIRRNYSKLRTGSGG